MKYGFVIPGGSLDEILDLATLSEKSGWDGFFYWDAIYLDQQLAPIYDAWTVLAAIATRTKKIRIGAMLTAVNRRRPWKLARESITVDHLSGGRLIIPTGLGALDDRGGYGSVGEPVDRKTRAELLDEGLDILTGLWSGKPFGYSGKHYKLEEMTFRETPAQKPRIPIWVVGAWPRIKSMQRAMKYDGLIPTKKTVGNESIEQVQPDDIREIQKFVSENRKAMTPFDIVQEGQTPVGKPSEGERIVDRWKASGVTWWIESRWTKTEEVRPRIEQGPPQVD
jgi:Luciferase-like monooxygenase